MIDMGEVPNVSSRRCYARGCYQKFDSTDTLRLRQQFYSNSFNCHRALAFAVQGQLQALPRKCKKYITLASKEVCKIAWYNILGITNLSTHVYKKNVAVGHVTLVHDNNGELCLVSHTIQAQAFILQQSSRVVIKCPISRDLLVRSVQKTSILYHVFLNGTVYARALML